MIPISHFTVMIIGADAEEALSPFDENLEVEPYRSYADSRTLEFYERAYKDEHGGAKPESWEALAAWLAERWGEEYHYEPTGGIYEITTANPQGKWDWWVVGGRWLGYFKLKQYAMDSASEARTGQPGTFDNEPLHDADIATRGEIDAEAMREDAGIAAGELWDRAQAVIAGTSPAESFESILARHREASSGEIEEALALDQALVNPARDEYHAQPRVRAAMKHDERCRKIDRMDQCILSFMGPGVEMYDVSREEFVQRARDAAICPFAYIKDGRWHAPGEMGWFGTSTDSENDRLHFQREFNLMFDALPDDTLLTLVDCHS